MVFGVSLFTTLFSGFSLLQQSGFGDAIIFLRIRFTVLVRTTELPWHENDNLITGTSGPEVIKLNPVKDS